VLPGEENIGLQIARLFVGQSPSVLSATLSAEFESSIVSCRKADANGVIDLLGQYLRAFCVVDTFHEFHNTSAIIQLDSEQSLASTSLPVSFGPSLRMHLRNNLCSEPSWMISDRFVMKFMEVSNRPKRSHSTLAVVRQPVV
jgi:hypothetical protein